MALLQSAMAEMLVNSLVAMHLAWLYITTNTRSESVVVGKCVSDHVLPLNMHVFLLGQRISIHLMTPGEAPC